ncbi:Telomerase-binding protein EST1A [Dirofilaria immitis]
MDEKEKNAITGESANLMNTPKGSKNGKKNDKKKENKKNQIHGEEFISDALWKKCDDDERDYILNRNDYANLNSHVGNRQPGNNGLLNADTCKVKMIFNEPLRKSSNSINKSCDHLIDGFSSPKTRLGRRMYSSSINCYSSSQSLCEDCSTDNNIYHYNGSVSSRFRTKISSLNRNEAFGLNSTSPSKNSGSYQKGHYPSSITYRCHQQQHHSQQGNSYCSGNVRHNSNKYHTVPMRCTSGDEPIYANDNDLSQTNFERHQRNWSFKINESQDFSQLFRHRNNKNSRMNRANNISQDSSQDAKGKESLTKKSGEVSKHISFQDLCASLDSIDLASFDWSSEVEAEEQRKKEQEEQIRMTEEQSSQTNSSSSQKKRSRRILESLSKFQSCSADVNRIGLSCSNHIKEPSHHFNNISRQQNDGSTSQASSIAECIEEQSEIEGGSGERTPTNDKRETTSNFSSQKIEEKGKDCYLDEKIQFIIRRLGKSRNPAINYAYRGVHENRGRNKRTSRWKMKKQHNPRESEVSTSDCNTTISQYIRSDSRRDNDLSAATSNALKATSPILKNITGSTTVALVARRSPREEHSDIPSPSNGSSTLLTKVSNTSLKRTKNNRFRKELLPPNEWPIHSEISCKEGPQIQALNDTINHLIDRITESADPSASEEILTASESLSKLYLSIITKNISYTYMMNLEQHLWKQCFYTSIEALRAASNATGNSSSIFRTSLSRLIQQGLAFYALLLNKYEIAFGFVIDDYLYWSSNLPVDDFVGCILIGSGAHEATDHIVKVALLSVQRLTVSIGDLHRYNSMTTGIKDYSHARVWYQKAAQLAAGNGRSYNQLALLAVYESKWIDVIFYYVRALAARYPFETARQPLFTAFNHVQKKVSEFEIEFNARVGDSVTREAEAAAARADRPQEIWIAQDGKLSSGDFANITDHRTIHALKSISTVELFRRAVPYLLHTSGLLITKIGMEEYDSISERALFQLSQLISRDECPLSSLHLVQLCILFLYAVHSLTLKNSEPDTCSLQQQQAVQMVLSLFGVILKPVYDELPDLSGILDGSIRLPSKMRRVLPAVFVISEWLSMPSVNRLYRSMPSLESIETSLIQVDTWKLLADVANTLVNAESRGILSRTVAQSNTKSEEHVEVVLPESVFLASFIDVFTVLPKSLKMSSLTNIDLRNNSPLLALHARLSSLLSTAEYLDGSELPCFGFDEHLRCFAATRCASPVTVLSMEIKEHNADFDQQFDNSEHKHETVEQDLSLFSDECKHHRQTIRENQVKQKLLERETKGNRMIIEVRPKYLVPDTNTFIDHLTSIKKIVESHRFTVLVPTTVFSELESLSRLSSSSKHIVGGQEDFQDHWVGERAKEAVAYLKDLIGKQVPQVYTITSKGNLLTSLMFATEEICTSGELKVVNDDFILSSCVNFAKTRSKPPNAVATEQSASTCMVDVGQPTRLYRSVVLLTEDRALNIKAVCENIPCRTVPSFMKWAAVK